MAIASHWLGAFMKLNLAIIFLLLFQFSSSSYGNSCENFISSKTVDSAVVDNLVSRNLLVNQNSVRGRSGLCGITCVFNALQILLVHDGHSPRLDLQELLIEGALKWTRPTGGLSQDGLVHMIKIVKKTYFPYMSAVAISGKYTGNITESFYFRKVERLNLGDLKPKPGSVLMMSVAGLKSTGEIGYHIFIVKSFNGNTLELVDPNAPEIDKKALLSSYGEYRGSSVPVFSFSGKYKYNNYDRIFPYSLVQMEIHN